MTERTRVLGPPACANDENIRREAKARESRINIPSVIPRINIGARTRERDRTKGYTLSLSLVRAQYLVITITRGSRSRIPHHERADDGDIWKEEFSLQKAQKDFAFYLYIRINLIGVIKSLPRNPSCFLVFAEELIITQADNNAIDRSITRIRIYIIEYPKKKCGTCVLHLGRSNVLWISLENFWYARA